ncbi:head decoration protein [Salmonella enterica subsp. enterica serovar Alachua]|nr:head decoration protein [Salmonella enterica subsp. enterica serovar Alachua]
MTVNSFGENPWVPGAQQDTFIPDQLVSGPLQLVTDTVTVTGAALYSRGTVLGQVTATGAYTLSVATAQDGSETPTAILADQADATASDVSAGVYLMGEFNGTRMIYDKSWTLDKLKVALRPSSIFVRDVVGIDM